LNYNGRGQDTVKTPVAASLLVIASLLGVACKDAPADKTPYPRDWGAHPAVVTISGAAGLDAVGDLHGDAEVAFHLLAAAGLITTTSPTAWAGGQRVLVVTGDIIDKGTSALPIIDLLMTLEPQARAAGGRVVVTIGNHEAEFLADPSGPKSVEFQAELRGAGFDPAAVARGETPHGAWLNELPVAAVVDGWFFCHAGDSEGRTLNAIGKRFKDAVDGPAGYGDDEIIGMGSILEANTWWQKGTSDVATLDEYLAKLPAKHIVLGHDPNAIEFPLDPQGKRKEGELAARYDGRLFMIDVGMSYAVGESTGALMRVTLGAAPSATTVFVDGTTKALWP
jgi:hypothetical protein